MEKKKPHYPLGLVKHLVADEGRDPFTQSAKNGAAEMELGAAYVKVTVYPQENLIVVSFKGL